MKVLHIDSSILGGNSVSRQLSAAVVERLRKATPDIDVTYRDLAEKPLSHLSSAHLAAAQGAVPENQMVRDDVAASQATLAEFLAADIVVIGAPMYNFTVPTQLKAWIDRVLIAGKTFKYTEKGPQGLVGDKQVILAISRGGLYGAGAPAAAAEHLETYLRTVFGFIGVANPEVIVAEGMLLGPEQRDRAVSGALQQAFALRAA